MNIEEYIKRIDSVTDDSETVEVMNIDPLYNNDHSVDALIAPIVEMLNDNGIKTRACCSGHEMESVVWKRTNGYLWIPLDIRGIDPKDRRVRWMYCMEKKFPWIYIDTEDFVRGRGVTFRWKGAFTTDQLKEMMKDMCNFIYNHVVRRRKR